MLSLFKAESPSVKTQRRVHAQVRPVIVSHIDPIGLQDEIMRAHIAAVLDAKTASYYYRRNPMLDLFTEEVGSDGRKTWTGKLNFTQADLLEEDTLTLMSARGIGLAEGIAYEGTGARSDAITVRNRVVSMLDTHAKQTGQRVVVSGASPGSTKIVVSLRPQFS